MLFGEHAVVYNRPCIVTAVNQRMKATVEIINEPFFILDAPDVQVVNYKKSLSELGKGDIPKGAKFVEIAIANLLRLEKILNQVRYDNLGIKVTTKSEFSSLFGFGSSSASTVCAIKALSVLFDIELSKKELFDLAYKTVLDVQKKGSGFDVAAAIYGGTLYFLKGGKIIEPLKVHQNLPLVVGYSGIKADTASLIDEVAKKDPKVVEDIYDEIEKIVEEAKDLFKIQNWEKLGKLMNKNQQLLQQLGVSIEKLDKMIEGSVVAGAYGAKLSGAGGGDCMIALCSSNSKHAVQNAISGTGGQVIDVAVNAEGVKIEL